LTDQTLVVNFNKSLKKTVKKKI